MTFHKYDMMQVNSQRQLCFMIKFKKQGNLDILGGRKEINQSHIINMLINSQCKRIFKKIFFKESIERINTKE